MFGFLNLYKPKGMTSFDAIRELRKILKIKQIGHTGTLDPLAEGVLPICIGKCTKLIDYLAEDKAYTAELLFGYKSDTFDSEGNVIKISDKKISEENLLEKLYTFEGKQTQIPPMYSAINYKGKRLYEYAREGKVIENIPQREITIDKINLKSFDFEKQIAQIYISCSRGTYIRSIVNDLGEKLGTGAIMTGLIRVKSGKFTVETSKQLSFFKDIDTIKNNLINPLDVLSYNRLEVDEQMCHKIKTGQAIQNENFNDNDLILLTKDDILISVGYVDKNLIKVKKVFI